MIGALLAVTGGAVLATVVVIDVFLTIIHPDHEGAIAKRLQRDTWRVAVLVGSRTRRHRRRLLAMAGPVMTVATFAVWILLFIVAFAFIFWPFMPDYRSEPELGRLDFIDALYYSGSTVTVLGYGDITPVAGGLKLLTIVASGVGLTLFTAIVTYLIELVSGIDERNRFALRVHDETGGSEKGADLPIRSLGREELRDLRERYDQWAAIARSVQDRLHRYAQASLFYRSQDRVYDPEPALKAAAEAAMAGYLLGGEAGRRLRPASENLDLAVTRIFGTLADQYLGDETVAALEDPTPGEEDVRYLESVGDHLRARLPEGYCLADSDGEGDGDGRALDLAFRTRVTLRDLDRITDWAREDGIDVPWA